MLDGGEGSPSHPGRLSSENESVVPIEQEAGWSPETVWTVWRGYKTLVPAEIQTPTVQPVFKSLYQLRYPGSLETKWKIRTIREKER
jgi:hypothetical protein